MLRSQAHLQVAPANAKTKTCKRACLPQRTADRNDAAKMKEKLTGKINNETPTHRAIAEKPLPKKPEKRNTLSGFSVYCPCQRQVNVQRLRHPKSLALGKKVARNQVLADTTSFLA